MCILKGFDSPKEWAKQNSKWSKIHRKRGNRGLAESLDYEYEKFGLSRFRH